MFRLDWILAAVIRKPTVLPTAPVRKEETAYMERLGMACEEARCKVCGTTFWPLWGAEVCGNIGCYIKDRRGI